MSTRKDGVVLHDKEFVADPNFWAEIGKACVECGDSVGRYPVDGKCNNCTRNSIADLWALARGLFVFVSCELEAERCGWVLDPIAHLLFLLREAIPEFEWTRDLIGGAGTNYLCGRPADWDRTRCLVVVLDDDYRADDAQSIVDAINMVRGVDSVSVRVSDITQHVAIETARAELRRKLHEVLR